MEKTILNLKSKLSVKSKMPVFSSNIFKKNTFKIKFKNTILIKNSNINKLSNHSFATLKCSSNNFFKTNIFNWDIQHSMDRRFIKDFDINNEEIIKNVREFKNVAIVFYELFNQKNKTNISKKDENLFHLLKNNEDKILDLQQFRSMKLEEVFDEEFIYFIKNSI